MLFPGKNHKRPGRPVTALSASWSSVNVWRGARNPCTGVVVTKIDGVGVCGVSPLWKSEAALRLSQTVQQSGSSAPRLHHSATTGLEEPRSFGTYDVLALRLVRSVPLSACLASWGRPFRNEYEGMFLCCTFERSRGRNTFCDHFKHVEGGLGPRATEIV